MPTISGNFNISDHDNVPGNPIEVIDQGAPKIAVSLWQKQGIGKDTPLLSATAWFYGSDAEFILDNFAPGNVIYVYGDATIEVNEDGYLDVNINDASFRYVPSDRTQSQQGASQPQGRDTAAQQNQSQQRGGQQGGQQPSTGPHEPSPQQPASARNQSSGGGQNRTGRDNAPAPRSRR